MQYFPGVVGGGAISDQVPALLDVADRRLHQEHPGLRHRGVASNVFHEAIS